MSRLSVICEKFVLNKSKTKIMIDDRQDNNSPQISAIVGYEVVNNFNYLGLLITITGKCESEILRRLIMARSATTKLNQIWKERSITKTTKLRLVDALVFPIATYAAETWTLNKVDKNRVEAFEMWVYRRLKSIVDRTPNHVSVLQEIGPRSRLLNRINRMYLQYLGHIARRSGTMERLIIEGKIEGKRSRGRSRK